MDSVVARRAFLPTLAVVLLLSNGCRVGGEPAARLTAIPSEITLAHGQMAPLEMTWEPLDRLREAKGPTFVFVHLLDRSGDLVRTFNHPLPARALSEPFEERVALYHSLIGPALPAGEYTLTAGLVDRSGERHALATTGDEVVRREYAIARVQVPEGPPEGSGLAASVAFSEQWSQAVPGIDHQVRASRKLATTGTVELRRPPAATSLALSLRLEEAGDAGSCAFAGLASRPEVRVRSRCSDFEVPIAGLGLHQIEAPLPVDTCVLELEPNFTCSPAAGGGLTLTLEQIGWVLAADAR